MQVGQEYLELLSDLSKLCHCFNSEDGGEASSCVVQPDEPGAGGLQGPGRTAEKTN